MKLRFLFFALLVLDFVPLVFSQKIDTIYPPASHTINRFINSKKLSVHSQHAPLKLDPVEVAKQKKWNIALTQHGINHGSDVPKNLVDSIKQAGSLLLHSQGFYNQVIDQDESTLRGPRDINPVVNASF